MPNPGMYWGVQLPFYQLLDFVHLLVLQLEYHRDDRPETGLGQMNAINIIAPYRYLDMWVFDDSRVGLSADIPNAEDGFVMLFSSTPFPEHQFRLEWRREEGNGNVYYAPELDAEGWLCPALLRYFASPPAEIYVQVRQKA